MPGSESLTYRFLRASFRGGSRICHWPLKGSRKAKKSERGANGRARCSSRPFFRRFFRGGDASKKAARSESQQRKIGLAGRDWRSSSVLTPPLEEQPGKTQLSPLRSLSLLWLLLPPRPRSFSLASTPVSSPFPLRRPPDARLRSSFSHHRRRQTTHSHAARTEVSFQPRLSSLSPGSFLSPRRRCSSPLSFIQVFARSSAFVEFVLSPVSQAFPNRPPPLSMTAGSAGFRFSSTPLCVSRLLRFLLVPHPVLSFLFD